MQAASELPSSGEDFQQTVAGIFSRAFATDPVMNWIIPAPALYRDFYALLVRDIFAPRGINHIDPQGRGAALWLPPQEKFEIPLSTDFIGLVARLALRRGPRPFLRIRQQGALFARHHPKPPHFHLVFVGCDPQHQGRGIGSSLIKEGTRVCDEAGMPAYLESSNPLNVPLYQRHGFEVQAESRLPGGGPPVWFMWREARG